MKLTVTGPGGDDTETKTGYIIVKEPAPVVDFSADVVDPAIGQTVTFTPTNTGGQVDIWAWTIEGTENTDYVYTGGTSSSSQIAQVQFLVEGTYDVSLTATGPDYPDSETKNNYIQVGAATIDVSVTAQSIDFGAMKAGVDSINSTSVIVTTTGGTAWSVTASATNGGYMTSGSEDLENAAHIANGGGAFQPMTSEISGFMTGTADEDRTDIANVKQVIAESDAPGDYEISVTFTGGFV